MCSRRDFLKQSGIAAAGLLAAPAALNALGLPAVERSTYKIGLQLYTVREAMARDPERTLAAVAGMGYREMESATYTRTEKFYGMDADTFAAVLRRNGLTVPSGHYGFGTPSIKGTIQSDWEHAVDDAASAGLRYMVCAHLQADVRKTIDDYKRVAERLNRAGAICQRSGIQFCYHNHNVEFFPIDGQVPYDILLQYADKDLVKMEMDIYWVTKAGYDPVAMFKKHPGRFILWHVKDMDKTPRQFFTEIGNGVIDWNRIFAHAEESGMKHFFVEQDKCPGDPFNSIAESADYLKKKITNKFKPWYNEKTS